MGSLRVGHDWATSFWLFTFMHWRRKWQPSPVSCLEKPRDREAWCAAVYGVAQSRTRLKQLSSSQYSWASLVAQLVKNPPVVQGTWVQSLDWEDLLEKEKATLSRILSWRVPWTISHGVTKSWTRLSMFHSLNYHYSIRDFNPWILHHHFCFNL